MRRSGDARAEILSAIRRRLAASAAHDIPLPVLGTARPEVASGSGASHDVLARFRERAEAAGARCELVCGELEAARVVARILDEAGARRVARSDAPLLERLAPALGGAFALHRIDRLSREDLFACDAGITTAQWGIAETGTLVLESARERSRLLSLVPPIHVALLSASRICDSLGDALACVGLASHAITLITGPSRTSDIELTLTIGVHGPRAVHIVLVADE